MDDIHIIVLHALLMWAGMGLCMPLGLILIRFLRATRQEGNTSLSNRIAKAHMLLQGVGLLLALAGGGLAIANFGAAGLAHTHGRLGLALLIAPFLTALLGIFRPDLGASWRRGLWYIAHWTLGTSTVVLAFLNIFIGMHVFELITATSLFRLNVAFSVQLALMAFIYLAQDRWAYMRQVQWSLPTKSSSTDHPPATNIQQEDVPTSAAISPASTHPAAIQQQEYGPDAAAAAAANSRKIPA